MAPGDVSLIIIQVFVTQILASNAQYVQYAGNSIPVPAYFSSYPVQGYAPNPVYQTYQPALPTAVPKEAPIGPKPTNVPSTPVYQPTAYQTSAYQQPIKASSVASAPEPPKLPTKPEPCKETLLDKTLPKDLLPTPPFDSNILNNLAIALQLLIITNLIHNPPPKTNSGSQDEDLFPAVAPLPIPYVPPSIPEVPSYPYVMPNANFIGTTSFGDTGISKSMMAAYGSPTLPSPRPAGLMSPYDAIGPNSPYLEQFQAKAEPKSPYHLTSDYKDLFSLTELFKI